MTQGLIGKYIIEPFHFVYIKNWLTLRGLSALGTRAVSLIQKGQDLLFPLKL